MIPTLSRSKLDIKIAFMCDSGAHLLQGLLKPPTRANAHFDRAAALAHRKASRVER